MSEPSEGGKVDTGGVQSNYVIRELEQLLEGPEKVDLYERQGLLLRSLPRELRLRLNPRTSLTQHNISQRNGLCQESG
ncbi:hypothetical protein Y1Q_0021379 [Alligator mississippiensis]|uniref:Uncharacterized protein n=1 Tax=Alligator mississippiensis TaxID=8496 RepID=A0A151P9E3_ALLMI|nr:hypothetical protein Y1Q_0021379 [Alligator mississippiensis]